MRISDDPILLQQFMSEGALARRVESERKRRGLSQERLAEQVERVLGGGFPQSAISKIEKSHGRRAITVDEALAFSKVFQIPLTELLMPEGVAIDQRIARLIRAWVEAKGAVVQAAAAEADTLEAILDEVNANTDTMEKLVKWAALGGESGALVERFLSELGLEIDVQPDHEAIAKATGRDA